MDQFVYQLSTTLKLLIFGCVFGISYWYILHKLGTKRPEPEKELPIKRDKHKHHRRIYNGILH